MKKGSRPTVYGPHLKDLPHRGRARSYPIEEWKKVLEERDKILQGLKDLAGQIENRDPTKKPISDLIHLLNEVGDYLTRLNKETGGLPENLVIRALQKVLLIVGDNVVQGQERFKSEEEGKMFLDLLHLFVVGAKTLFMLLTKRLEIVDDIDNIYAIEEAQEDGSWRAHIEGSKRFVYNNKIRSFCVLLNVIDGCRYTFLRLSVENIGLNYGNIPSLLLGVADPVRRIKIIFLIKTFFSKGKDKFGNPREVEIVNLEPKAEEIPDFSFQELAQKWTLLVFPSKDKQLFFLPFPYHIRAKTYHTLGRASESVWDLMRNVLPDRIKREIIEKLALPEEKSLLSQKLF